jgi:hypothetical protein
MAGKRAPKAAKAACWRLENADARIDVERRTGFIRSLYFKKAGLDLFAQTRGGIPGYIGGLRLYDEHDDRWYDDRQTPFTVSAASKRGGVIRLTRRYRGAPFTVTLTFEMAADGLRWKVQAQKVGGRVADRSLRVHFMMPLIAGWDVWAPCKFGEVTFDGMTPFEFMYVQVPYVSDQEIILPMVSHYHRGLGAGYSMVLPIDANVPAAKFVFNNADRCFNWGTMHKDPRTVPVLEAVNYYIGLVGARPMSTELMLMFHDGDWRCGLGRVYRRWQEYFDPYNPAIYEREGCFFCGGVDSSDEADRLAAMGAKTFEVHGHFQEYGDYCQDGKDKWHRLSVREGVYRKMTDERKEALRTAAYAIGSSVAPQEVEAFLESHTDEEVAAYLGLDGPERLYHRRDDVRRRLQVLADAGIACHWYFNYTDGYRPRAERDWPDAISKDEDGRYVPSGWYMCHNMNADPRWSFGRFCCESARKIFDAYPMLSGFFMDCFRHFEIDFGHDDGVTVVHGKPAYSMNHSYDDIERLIKETVMKPRNLTSFANKPMSIRSMRYCDGHLLEGDGDRAEEKFFWASIACPMFYLWSDPNRSVDEFLRRSVVHGAWPTLVERSDANLALFRRYLPLFAQFKRRVLCFEADPLRPPRHSRGKLYTVPDGYVAGLMSEWVDQGDQIAYARRPYALFRVGRGHDIGRVGVMYPGDAAMRDVGFKFDGTFLAVPLADYRNSAVVKLFVTADTARPIGPDHFHSRGRMCEDPESAFEDISER